MWGPRTEMEELRLTLPVGWKAKLPPSDTASSVFGTYVAEYTQKGQELRIARSLTGTEGVWPASRNDDLLAWMKKMSADDAKYVVLEH